MSSGKPVASVVAPHGPERWVTSLSCLRGSDLLTSGSSDGFMRFWQLGRSVVEGSKGKKKKQTQWRLEEIASHPVQGVVNGIVQKDLRT